MGMKDTKQKSTANSNSITNFIFYFLLIMSISISLSTILILKNTDTSFTKSLGKNWSSSPLTKFTQRKKNCKIDEISLINNSWEGTKDGCNCDTKNPKNFRTNTSSPKFIKEGKCFSELISDNVCKNISPNPKIPYKVWKGKFMCGQKNEINYFENEIVEKIEECAIKNLKPCGRIDTNGNILCIEKKENCPFNYDKNFSNSQRKYKNFSEKLSVKFEGKKYLTGKSQKLKSKPLLIQEILSADIPFIPVEFIIEANLPCAYKGKKNFNLTSTDDDTPKCKKVYTNEKYDFSYTKLDTAIKTRVFKENNILNANQKNQKISKEEKNYLKGDLNLFSRSFVGLNKKCFDNIKNQGNGDMIISNLLTSDENNKEIIQFLQICVFASLIALIFERIFLKNLWNHEYYTTLIIFYFYFSVVFISISYNLINLILEKSSKFNGMYQIFDKNCLGDLAFESIKGYFFSVNESIFMITMILLINLFLVTCEIYKLTIAFGKSSISSSLREKEAKLL